MAELVRVKMVDPILGRKLTHISSGGLWMHGLLGISGVASLGKDPNGGANILLLCFKGLKHGKMHLIPVAGDQIGPDGWVDLEMDRVYGYCTLLERYLTDLGVR